MNEDNTNNNNEPTTAPLSKSYVCPILEQRYKRCVADVIRYQDTQTHANIGDTCQKMYDELMYHCFMNHRDTKTNKEGKDMK